MEYIRPDDVRGLAESLVEPWMSDEERILSFWAYISINFHYFTPNGMHPKSLRQTLADSFGVCEDFSTLLVSLARAVDVPPDDIFVAQGFYDGEAHAWVVWKGMIVETTLPPSVGFRSALGGYLFMGLYNDIIEAGQVSEEVLLPGHAGTFPNEPAPLNHIAI